MPLLRAIQRYNWALIALLYVLYAIVYFLSARYIPFADGVDPAVPIGAALLFFTDLWVAPALLVVALAAEAVAGLPASALIISATSGVVQAALAAFLVRYWHVDPIFRLKRDVLYTIAA